MLPRMKGECGREASSKHVLLRQKAARKSATPSTWWIDVSTTSTTSAATVDDPQDDSHASSSVAQDASHTEQPNRTAEISAPRLECLTLLDEMPDELSAVNDSAVDDLL